MCLIVYRYFSIFSRIRSLSLAYQETLLHQGQPNSPSPFKNMSPRSSSSASSTGTTTTTSSSTRTPTSSRHLSRNARIVCSLGVVLAVVVVAAEALPRHASSSEHLQEGGRWKRDLLRQVVKIIQNLRLGYY